MSDWYHGPNGIDVEVDPQGDGTCKMRLYALPGTPAEKIREVADMLAMSLIEAGVDPFHEPPRYENLD